MIRASISSFLSKLGFPNLEKSDRWHLEICNSTANPPHHWVRLPKRYPKVPKLGRPSAISELLLPEPLLGRSVAVQTVNTPSLATLSRHDQSPLFHSPSQQGRLVKVLPLLEVIWYTIPPSRISPVLGLAIPPFQAPPQAQRPRWSSLSHIPHLPLPCNTTRNKGLRKIS